ncbi:MAG TPA: GNAT family protein [Caulobacter sp.]|nr:GNAT family protein [Caulobacter sp.]
MDLKHIPLEGRHVRLEPYADANREAVRRALDVDPDGWSLFVRTGMGEHFDQWWSNAMEHQATGLFANYAVRRLSDGQIVGSTSFLEISPAHSRVEVGATFLHPAVRSGAVNPESKRLLLAHAFDSGAVRVEIITDLRNLRSQAAIAKLGAVREGVLRKHKRTWSGYMRDTVVYSVIDDDWPAVRERLDARLSAFQAV